MSITQLFPLSPIMHHEKPAGHSLLRCMQSIARNSLLNLRQQRFGVANEEIADMFAGSKFVS